MPRTTVLRTSILHTWVHARQSHSTKQYDKWACVLTILYHEVKFAVVYCNDHHVFKLCTHIIKSWIRVYSIYKVIYVCFQKIRIHDLKTSAHQTNFTSYTITLLMKTRIAVNSYFVHKTPTFSSKRWHHQHLQHHLHQHNNQRKFASPLAPLSENQ